MNTLTSSSLKIIFVFALNYAAYLANPYLGATVSIVIAASVKEYVIHRWILHYWMWLTQALFRAHHQVHHRLMGANETFHAKDDEVRSKIPMKWYIHGPAIVISAWIPWIAFTYYFVENTSLASFITWFSVSFFTLNYIAYEYYHWCMHDPQKRWFEKTWLYMFLKKHHILHHHRMIECNFNTIIVLADWMFGTLRFRSVDEFDQVRSHDAPDAQPIT